MAVATAAILASGVGCRSFSPRPLEEVPFRERAETRALDEVTVTAVVLSAEEARAAFDARLYKKRIQPVWLEIRNDSPEPLWLLPRSLDPDYFSPFEVAQKTTRGRSATANRAKRAYLDEHRMPLEIPSGQSRDGFVFTNRDRGVSWLLVELVGEDRSLHAEFLQEVPGFRADFHRLDRGQVYGSLYPDREIVDLDGSAFLAWVESQPSTTTNAAGEREGDPINLVIVGQPEAVWPAFLRSGWDPTTALTTGSALRTGFFGVFGGAWRYSPISSLYLWDRPQDLALQKVRSNIHYRNHLRLWLAPVTFRGQPVLLGQISRDIGSRLTTRSPTLTTHRIDPDVDEARGSLIQDFLYAQALAAFTLVSGVGDASLEEPRRNLTGDPWFSDGKRAVMLLSAEPVGLDEVDWLDW